MMRDFNWLASDDPVKMLLWLLPQNAEQCARFGVLGRSLAATERKLRLFAYAGCRQSWVTLTRSARSMVECVEKTVEGEASDEQAWRQCAEGIVGPSGVNCIEHNEVRHIAGSGEYIARLIARPKYLEYVTPSSRADLLREVFGNPFRTLPLWWNESKPGLGPIAQPEVNWITPEALMLVGQAYRERTPDGSLDPVTLAAASDALEEAGCSEDGLLTHLRSPGPHFRGCWVVDLILGKR